MLLLRPHHINCLFFYQGLGYSNNFTIGMDKLVTLIKENPYSKVMFIVGCDILCNNCPNRQVNNCCITQNKVNELDYNTLRAYNIKENKLYTFHEIIDTIYKNFSESKFNKICSSCNWYKKGICTQSIISCQIEKWDL